MRQPRGDAWGGLLPFVDRPAAGKALASRLSHYAGRSDTTVLGIPRGGVPVARMVADLLSLPVQHLPVQKIYVRGNPVPLGAVVDDDIEAWDEEVLKKFNRLSPVVTRAMADAREALRRRRQAHYDGQTVPIEGRCVIIVDDGLESGVTMHAAITAARVQGAVGIVVAVPVAPAKTIGLLRNQCDELVCLASPEPFHDIGQSYLDYPPMTDESVTGF